MTRAQLQPTPAVRVTPYRHAAITGGMGFIGSHLADALVAGGTKVTLIDNLATGRIENVAHLADHPAVDLVVEDVVNEADLDPLLTQCDVIFHLAAVVGVDRVMQEPVETILTNVTGTEVVLRCAARHGTKILIASTSETYGKGVAVPFAEEDDVVLGPTSKKRWSYAASKMIDEFLALAYASEQGLPVVVFRLFNTVGPRQTGQYGMVLPRFVEAAIDGRPLNVYGDGEQSRCFLHVGDAVDAILLLAESSAAVGQVFNVGSIDSVTINGLAEIVTEMVEKRIGSNGSFVRHRDPADIFGTGYEDIRCRIPDISKIREHIGWQPTRSIVEILDECITMELENRASTGTESHLTVDLTHTAALLAGSGPRNDRRNS
jgi:UDP-glucose 4-epimerase